MFPHKISGSQTKQFRFFDEYAFNPEPAANVNVSFKDLSEPSKSTVVSSANCDKYITYLLFL